jgi:hypothetical protein
VEELLTAARIESGGLGLVDDDGLSVPDADLLTGHGLKLHGEVTSAPRLVDAGLVIVAAEVLEAGVGVRQKVVDDGQLSTELPTATIAFCLPRRRARRRYRSPRKLSVRAAAATMLPSVPASHGLPLPRPLSFFLPAD